MSGFLSVVVDADRPRFLGPALADAITGIYAAFGVLGALLERASSGRGKLVEVSMLEAMAHFAVEPFAAFFALGIVPKSSDRPRLAQAYILRTADDKLIAIHLSSLEKFWLGLVKALEADELTRDARFSERLARIANYEALGAELDRRFRAPHAARVVRAAECQRRAVRAHQRHRRGGRGSAGRPPGPHRPGERRAAGRTRRRCVPPLQFDGERARAVSAAPLLDQHGAAIRAAVNDSRHWPASIGRRGTAPRNGV